MNITICDDVLGCAHDLRNRITDYCAQKDWPLNCTICSSALELVKMDLSSCRAVFLDIDMPEMSGLEAAEFLHNRYPDLLIIFVTGFIQYAPAGYRVSAFRYLLKEQINSDLPQVMEDLYCKLVDNEKTFFVKTKDGGQIVPIKNILYLEGTSHRRVIFHLNNSIEPIEAMGSLSSFAEELEEKGFLKLQKSYLVNMAHVIRIHNYLAQLDDNTVLKVSDMNYRDIQRAFLLWKGDNL